MKKATHQQTKQHNRNLVLRTIFTHEAISRAEIARITKLTRTTVSDVVSGLLTAGLVEEIGLGASIGGKLPILLSIVPDSRYLLGLNLSQDKFIGAVVNLRGEIKETVEIPINEDNSERSLEIVYQIVQQLISTNRKPIVGIGVGTPGLVNTREGVVNLAVNLSWQNLPLGNLLQERFHVPVMILNDSQATAIGEFVYGGEHKADSNLVVVTLRQGIGAGILINGKLFQGDGGGAGEIGHVLVKEDGELCRCGKRGCLETVASARAVLQRSGLASLEAVEAAFRAGNPAVQAIVLEAGRYLGLSLAALVGTLNIHKIVLTGDMTRFGEPWLAAVSRSMQAFALARMVQDTRLEIGKLDYRGYILGAAALIMLLDDYSLLLSSSQEASIG